MYGGIYFGEVALGGFVLATDTVGPLDEITKVPASWLNDIVKFAGRWVPATETPTAWASNITKISAIYVPITKGTALWLNNLNKLPTAFSSAIAVKAPAAWSNNDVKPAGIWLTRDKTTGVWVNNIQKQLTQFTPITHGTTPWGPNFPAELGYLYDDETVVYDSLDHDYDIIVNGNQINQRVQTAWSLS